MGLTVLHVFDAHGARAVEQQARDMGLRLDRQVRPFLSRAQEGGRGARSTAVADRHLQIAEALLACTVEVVVSRITGCNAGFDKGIGERMRFRWIRDGKLAVGAVKCVPAALLLFAL